MNNIMGNYFCRKFADNKKINPPHIPNNIRGTYNREPQCLVTYPIDEPYIYKVKINWKEFNDSNRKEFNDSNWKEFNNRNYGS